MQHKTYVQLFYIISIPYGAIKRKLFRKYKNIYKLISIPYGAIKRGSALLEKT